MRLWSGASSNYGTDDNGPAVVVEGPTEARATIAGEVWKLDQVRKNERRIWRPVGDYAEVRSPKPPVAASHADTLTAAIENAERSGLHPALENDLKGEAQRLFPKLNDAVAGHFDEFVDYLGETFGLDARTWMDEPLVAYTDGFGPLLMLRLDEDLVPLPEVPPIYDAPESWRQTSWWVTNHMVGPLMMEEVPAENQIQYNEMQRTDNSHTPLMEGLVYYQSARMVAAWEGWTRNASGRYLEAFIELITSGQRPWQAV
jgi:hypothetical protein